MTIKTYAELCSKCTTCTFMPKQDRERTLQWSFRELGAKTDAAKQPLILVLDDCYEPEVSFTVAAELLSERNFTLTSTVRCRMAKDASTSQIYSAVDSCAVWTKPLLEGRKLILSTGFGLRQMGIGNDDKTWGDILKSPKYGYILVLPALELMEMIGNFHHYKSKINRLLKECKL